MKDLILDFDGTLVDPTYRDYQLYVDIMREMGHSVLSLEEYWPLRCDVTPIGNVLKMTGGPDVDVDTFLRLRLERHEEICYLVLDRPLPMVYEALDAMRKRFKLHLVSARGNLHNLAREATLLDFCKYFESIAAVCGSKSQRFLTFRDAVAVIGDTEHDMQPATEVGIPAIGVTTGIRSRRFLEPIADHVVDSLSEALEVINEADPTC